MRKKIHIILRDHGEEDKLSRVYDIAMIICIIVSLVPLAFREDNTLFKCIDFVTVAIFIVDYILRIITADLKIKKGVLSFVLYPFTPMAILDLVSILPSLTVLHNSFRLLKLFRLLRTFKVLRAFRVLRYSKNVIVISNVFRKQKKILLTVATLAAAYIMVSALVIYNVEPESFATFFDAVYWATISLTTVGYGDIYPVTTIGRIVTMVSSLFGIAVIALPSGVITAGYLSEIDKDEDKERTES